MARSKKKKGKKRTAGVRGQMRKAHFESGGSTAEWRGLHRVHSSQKRRSRKTDEHKAIKDSEDGKE